MPSPIFNRSTFDNAKNLSKPRTKFKRPSQYTTTFNIGDIVPLYVDEVLPGDTWKIDTNKFIRLSTPVNPTMDDLYFETFWFFVPNRLTWDHWEQFCGASDKAWVDPNTTYTIPTIVFNGAANNGHAIFYQHSLAGYLTQSRGAMSALGDVEISALPFRAYGLIYNYFFRDENLEDVIPVYTGDSSVIVGTNDTQGQDYYFYNGAEVFFDANNSCLKAMRFHDYFTSALPGPQKGPDALIPAGGFVSLQVPPSGFTATAGFSTLSNAGVPTSLSSNYILQSGQTYAPTGYVKSRVAAGSALGNVSSTGLLYDPAGTLGFNNLEITINNLRNAIITQQWLELNARSGSRYQEYLLAHWAVDAGDARLQIPEYLGGSMTLLNMNQVIQTSETSTTPLGTLAGNSVTYSSKHEVFKSFVEHGIIMCLGVARAKTTYGQGMDAMWFRQSIYDFFDPLFANVSEQPIYNREIYFKGDSYSGYQGDDVKVFGYKEAWSEYKFKADKVGGYFNPSLTGNIGTWTYATNYNTLPYLSESWLRQGVSELDRTLQVASTTGAPQFLAQFAFDVETTREMPRYNVPGLHRI